MTYEEFLSLANSIGSGGVVVGSLHGTSFVGALEHEGSRWFICQNVNAGSACTNRHGYLYSWAVSSDNDVQGWELTRPEVAGTPARTPRIGFRYGIEIECKVPYRSEDSVDERCSSLGIDCGSDGSISCGDNQVGREYRVGPVTMTQLEAKIHSFGEVANEYKLSVDQSCGLHIHVSHPKMINERSLKRIVGTWVAIEDVLFSTQPKSRLNNRYCIRKLRSHAIVGFPKLPKEKAGMVSTLASDDRYQALNLVALRAHGTIECRLHAGTVSAEKIINWAKLLKAFYNYAIFNYNAKDVNRVFKLKTSRGKVRAVWDLLGLDEDLRKHFDARIDRFSFPKLERQNLIARKLIGNKRKKVQLNKVLSEAKTNYEKVVNEESRLARAFLDGRATI